MSRGESLYALLCRLLPESAALRRFVVLGPHGAALQLELPGEGAATAALAIAIVQEFERQGLVSVTLERLLYDYPMERAAILEVARLWGVTLVEAPVGQVYVAHHYADRVEALRLAHDLKARGVSVWLDVWEPCSPEKEESARQTAIQTAVAVIVCTGPHGPGPWHDRESRWMSAANRVSYRVRLPGAHPSEDDPAVFAGALRVDASRRDDALAQLAAWTLPRAALSPAARKGPFEECPYPGIDHSFGAEQAAWFHGREETTEGLLQALERERWVWLVGNSGSGKSSLASAGVAAWWPTWGSTPGEAMVLTCVRGFDARFTAAVADLCKRVGVELTLADRQQLDETPAMARTALREAQRKAPRRILVVLDQAELLLGTTAEGDVIHPEAVAAVTAIVALTADHALDVRVICVLRADRYDAALRVHELVPVWRRSTTQVTLTKLPVESLRRAIERPARCAGGEVDPDVVTRLVEAVHASDGLPLLQWVLQELWTRARPLGRITLLHLPRGDDVLSSAIANRLRLIAGSPSALNQLVPQLVDVDPFVTPRRRTAHEREILDEATLQQLWELVAARVVVTGRDAGGATWIFAHEAVLRVWKDLASAIAVHRSALALRAEADAQARRWHTQGRASAYLPQGVALARLTPVLQLPIEQVTRDLLEQAARAERRRRSLVKAALSALVLIALLVVGLAGRCALVTSDLAEEIEVREYRSRLVLAANSDPLYLQAVLNNPPEAARPALPELQAAYPLPAVVVGRATQFVFDSNVPKGNAAEDWPLLVWRPTGTNLALRAGRSVVLDSEGSSIGLPVLRPYGAEWSPDGSLLLVWNSRCVHALDTSSWTGVAELCTEDIGGYGAWSPDSRRFALETTGGIRLWGAKQAEQALLPNEREPFWSPDGEYLCTRSTAPGSSAPAAEPTPEGVQREQTLHVWRVGSQPELVASIEGCLAAWSPVDASLLVQRACEASALQTIVPKQNLPEQYRPTGPWRLRPRGDFVIWRTDLSEVPLPHWADGSLAVQAEWSPDGRVVALMHEQALEWWSVQGVSPDLLGMHPIDADRYPAYTPIRWDAGGTRILLHTLDRASGMDLRASIIDVDLRVPPRALAWPIRTASWSPSGRWLAAITPKGKPLVLDEHGREYASLHSGWEPVGNSERADEIAWSPTDDKVAVYYTSGEIRIWQIAGPALQRLEADIETTDYRLLAQSASWSPTGKSLAVMQDKRVYITYPDGGGPLRRLEGGGFPVRMFAWRPDGRFILATNERWIRLIPVEPTAYVPPMESIEHEVERIAWRPDGATVALAGDRKISIYAPESSIPIQTIETSINVLAMTWSPDGQRLVIQGFERTQRTHVDGAPKEDQAFWSWRPGADLEPRPLRGSGQRVGVTWAGGLRTAAFQGGSLQIWGEDDPTLDREIEGPRDVDAIAWSSDGRQLAIASSDYTASTWDALDGGLRAELRHDASVRHIEWNADGAHVLTMTQSDARIWRVDGTGEPLHYPEVSWAAFSPDGRDLVTSDRTMIVRRWQPADIAAWLDSPAIHRLDPREQTQWLRTPWEDAVKNYKAAGR